MSLLRLPAFALFLVILGLAMLGPALFAALTADWKSGRSFLYAAIFTLFAAAVIGTLFSGAHKRPSIQVELTVLVASWLIIPALAAIPLALITPRIGVVGAWFEMVLCFTTTGSTSYLEPGQVEPAIHLWRGMVGWLGGLLTLAAAYVIMAPRRLGGFEVAASAGTVSSGHAEFGGRLVTLDAATPGFGRRLNRAMRVILPIYAGITAALAGIFSMLGQGGLTGAIHAMSIVSTSGITPLAGGFAASSSLGIEMVAAVFLVLSATRLIYARASQAGSVTHWSQDPELRLMGILVGLATLTLFLRHWFGALSIKVSENLTDALAAIWGSAFTALSFLTTTGFVSSMWQSARDWSGLSNPGLILLALCAVGGGAATTAGGIKLIRAYALLRHGLRELDRIALPNGIIGVGSGMRGIMREGAFIAWAFIMLFILSIFVVILGLTITGMKFETALVASIATLTNTGPAISVVLEGETGFALLGVPERLILAGSMILGRIETLGVIALFSIDFSHLLGRANHHQDSKQ